MGLKGFFTHLHGSWRGGGRGQPEFLTSLVSSALWHTGHPMKGRDVLWGCCWPVSLGDGHVR